MTLFGKAVFGITGIILAAGLYYGLSYSGTVEKIPSSEEVSEETSISLPVSSSSSSLSTATTSVKKMAFSEFLRQGGSYKCTVSQVVATMTSEGIVYINKDSVKAEFVTSISGVSIKTFMIIKDGYTYTWTSAAPTKGYKTKITTEGSLDRQTSSTKYTWDGSQIGDYSCETHAPDPSIFVLPSTIIFTEST